MNVGSLFSGIGGFDLGFERCGMEIAWQVERDPYCRAVLASHFPDAERFEDVREVGASELAPVDLICGGFPCQDLSFAGKGAGLDGARSGLWSEFARIVRELRPGYVVVENVPALLTGKGKRWDRAPVGRVLADLAALRYDAEWACLSAREFGAPHLRKRVFLVAYPQGVHEQDEPLVDDPGRSLGGARPGAGGRAQRRRPSARGPVARRDQVAGGPRALAEVHRRRQGDCGGRREGEVGDGEGRRRPACHWAVEPAVGRVAHGVPDRVDRLGALGNALVPQIAEWVGRRIVEYEERELVTARRELAASSAPDRSPS